MEKEKKLPEYDHRVLGRELNLFSIQESLGGGLPLLHPKGTVIYNIIMDFMKKELIKRGYDLVVTPHIAKSSLWKKSGHYNMYKEHMFFTKIDEQEYGIKPMNCPGHVLIYKSKSRSYRDLPIRYGEFGVVYRNELSGVLSGLARVRMITQDDAHIFCRVDQIESEVKALIDLAFFVYKVFGFKDVKVELSTMPKKHIGSDEIWRISTESLKDSLNDKKIKFKINKGDGAFYGPKIDFHVKDALGRYWQLSTIQLDFNMPERFNLNYIGKDNKKHQPVIIHRAIFGSIERFLSILIENYKGAFPLWLAPVQVVVININDKLKKYAKSIEKALKEEGFRVEGDYRSESIQYKVREAEMQKIPVVLVVGEKELKAKTIAVRPRGQKVKFGVKVADFIKDLKAQEEKKK